MSPFNKQEAIGIFVSVVIMALALSVVRFKTDMFALVTKSDTQGAVVVTAKNPEKDNAVTEGDVRDALYDSFSLNGKLLKLVVDDVRIGNGDAVEKGDTIEVNYVGTTQDGIKFDSSYDRGETFVFTVGKGEVIQGWEEGLIGMKEGGERILVIPSEMAYGNRQVGPIPPNTPLVFAIELVDVR